MHRIPWLAIAVLLAVPPGAGYGAAEAAGTGVLDHARWVDSAGEQYVGIDGSGVSIWSREPYDATMPDLDQCNDGEHLAVMAGAQDVSVGPHALPKADNTGHGSFIAGVLCGDGTASGGRVKGIAPGATVFAWTGMCLASCDLSSWWAEPSLRVYTWSSESDQVEATLRIGRPDDLDILFVAAVGNDGGDGTSSTTLGYLNSDARLLGVAATTFDGQDLAHYSSRGARDDPTTWPDLAAPGCLMSPVPVHWLDYYALSLNNYAGTELGARECPQPPPDEFAELTAAGHVTEAGTSFATPVVAGVAALMFQVHADMTALEAKYILTRTADAFLPVPGVEGNVTPEQFRAEHGYAAGWGRLNATRAVAAAHFLAVAPNATIEEAVACGRTGQGKLNEPLLRCTAAADESAPEPGRAPVLPASAAPDDAPAQQRAPAGPWTLLALAWVARRFSGRVGARPAP